MRLGVRLLGTWLPRRLFVSEIVLGEFLSWEVDKEWVIGRIIELFRLVYFL